MCKILTERGNKWRSQTTLFFESTNVSWHKSGVIDRGQVISRWGRICVIIKPKSQKYFLFFYVDKMGANAILFKALKNINWFVILSRSSCSKCSFQSNSFFIRSRKSIFMLNICHIYLISFFLDDVQVEIPEKGGKL